MIENAISTNENLVQDNSSIECVSPETNPIATIQTEPKNLASANQLFDFHAVHNGEACIESLDPKDRGTERRFRFTRALLCTLLGVKSENTITNHVQALINRGVINDVKNLTSLNIKNENGNGAVKMTLYDLKVFNYLVMRLDTDQAWEKKAKFNDVLVERETGVAQAQTQPTIFDYARALIAEKERSDALEAQNKALQAEHAETKVLLAEEKEKVEYLERSKSWIGDKKVATAMGTAGAKSKECERLKKEVCNLKSEMDLKIYNACSAIRKEYEESWVTAREWCYKHGLPVKTDQPKWTVSAKLVEICASYPDREPQWHPNARGTRLFPKWACDILDKMYDEDDTFLKEYRKV